MERNDIGAASRSGSTDGSTSGSGPGINSSTSGSTANAHESASGSGGNGMKESASGLADRARDLASNAQDKLSDAGSAVRDRAGNLKNSLADALDTGADKLRNKTSTASTGQLAGAVGTSVAALDDGRLAHAGESVAGGMKATADWLRDADLDGLKSGLEQQVKQHPGRTLLIAAGVGYLLGKAFRK